MHCFLESAKEGLVAKERTSKDRISDMVKWMVIVFLSVVDL